mmetsp:Transcript_24181/g.40517  ORF Transcript_24181/g.40517 Transcript_24181/m.40517 type:complete len:915 (+) Transcript_24181:413-3157(+)
MLRPDEPGYIDPDLEESMRYAQTGAYDRPPSPTSSASAPSVFDFSEEGTDDGNFYNIDRDPVGNLPTASDLTGAQDVFDALARPGANYTPPSSGEISRVPSEELTESADFGMGFQDAFDALTRQNPASQAHESVVSEPSASILEGTTLATASEIQASNDAFAKLSRRQEAVESYGLASPRQEPPSSTAFPRDPSEISLSALPPASFTSGMSDIDISFTALPTEAELRSAESAFANLARGREGVSPKPPLPGRAAQGRGRSLARAVSGISETGMSALPTVSEMQATDHAFAYDTPSRPQDDVETYDLDGTASDMGMSAPPTASNLVGEEADEDDDFHYLERMQDEEGIQAFNNLAPSSTGSPRGGTSEMGMSMMPTGSELQAAEAALGNLTKRAGQVAHDTPRSPQKPTTPQEGFQSFGFDESDSSGTSTSRGPSYHPGKGLEIENAYADSPSDSLGFPNPQDSRLLRALEDADVSSFGPSPALYEGPVEPLTTSTPQAPRDEPGTPRGGPQTPSGGLFSKIKKDLQRTFSGQEASDTGIPPARARAKSPETCHFDLAPDVGPTLPKYRPPKKSLYTKSVNLFRGSAASTPEEVNRKILASYKPPPGVKELIQSIDRDCLKVKAVMATPHQLASVKVASQKKIEKAETDYREYLQKMAEKTPEQRMVEEQMKSGFKHFFGKKEPNAADAEKAARIMQWGKTRNAEYKPKVKAKKQLHEMEMLTEHVPAFRPPAPDDHGHASRRYMGWSGNPEDAAVAKGMTEGHERATLENQFTMARDEGRSWQALLRSAHGHDHSFNFDKNVLFNADGESEFESEISTFSEQDDGDFRKGGREGAWDRRSGGYNEEAATWQQNVDTWEGSQSGSELSSFASEGSEDLIDLLQSSNGSVSSGRGPPMGRNVSTGAPQQRQAPLLA